MKWKDKPITYLGALPSDNMAPVPVKKIKKGNKKPGTKQNAIKGLKIDNFAGNPFMTKQDKDSISGIYGEKEDGKIYFIYYYRF